MKDYLDSAGELLDKLALEVMMLEPKDIEGRGVVLNHLDEVSGLFKDAGRHVFADLARGMRSIAEKLASGEHPEPEQGMKQIEDGISLFQEILREVDDVEACSKKIKKYLCESGLPDNAAAGDEPVESGDDLVEKQDPDTAQDEDYPAEKQDADLSQDEDDLAEKQDMDLAKDKELIEGFIAESREHLDTVEVNVLSLEQDPENLDLLNAIIGPFHTIKGISGFLNLTDINRLAHEVENLLEDAANQKLIVDESLTDLILDAADLMKAMVSHLGQELNIGFAQEPDFRFDDFLDHLRDVQVGKAKVEVENKTQPLPMADGTDTGEILLEKGAVTTRDVEEALEKQVWSEKKIGELLMEDKRATARDVVRALRDQKKLRVDRAPEVSTAFAKVDTEKLDNMVDMVGELVINQAMLGQNISGLVDRDKKLYGNLAQLDRITSEIQRVSMSLRMIAIKQTFQKMIRLVRDLSRKSGKLVNLEMIGEDTEMDRNMVDEIYDPLVHLVRNSIDHSIETPDVRRAMGKPETGTVALKAYHKGGNIVIEISEDGKGLDREKIINKAVERKLIGSGDKLSEQEIFNLILRPGFSTAEKVSDVSGRGVGLDVAKRAVDKMRGKLEIQSVKDQGTTILMRLPLTMAIIDGIIVRAGDRDFIIPTASVIESIRPDRSAYNNVANRGEMIRIRDSLFPLVRLHSLFDFDSQHKDPWEAIVVLAESDERRKCLLVDDLIGKQEVVIKSLGERLKKVKGLAGCAILADGRVGLILDVPGLFELSEKK